MIYSNRNNMHLMVVALEICFVILVVCVSNSLTISKFSDHYSGSRVKPSLRMVIAISRHGYRAPLGTFPKDPYQPNNTNYWPFGASQLTLRGRLQMYNLGKRIRALYNGFLDDYHYQNNFKAYSTDVDRTIVSAQLFLAGLFPPKGFQVWNDKFEWQPIPVHWNKWDNSEDAMTNCPRYIKELHLNFAKYEQDEKQNNTILLESIQPYTGIDISGNYSKYPTSNAIFNISDSIISANEEGLPIPAWAQAIYSQLQAKRAQGVLKILFQFNALQYTSGPFLKIITNLMKTEIKNNKRRNKMYYFSSIDITVMGLKKILGIPVATITNPGSIMIFELHEEIKSGNNFVEVVYIDGKTLQVESINNTMSGCQVSCDFSAMENISKRLYNFTDLINECQEV